MSEFKPQYKARFFDGKVEVLEVKVLAAPNKRGEIKCERTSVTGFMAMVPQDWLSKTPEHAREVFLSEAKAAVECAEKNLQLRREILKAAL